MQQLDLKGKRKQRKYRSYKGEVGKITENLLQQDFTQQRQMKNSSQISLSLNVRKASSIYPH
ncbi:transposase insK for insertion sequence element IS150 [Actinobacillus equuli]|nr:transposase insK for insertion sequence element IS150 [Actinobacillus equuli]